MRYDEQQRRQQVREGMMRTLQGRMPANYTIEVVFGRQVYPGCWMPYFVAWRMDSKGRAHPLMSHGKQRRHETAEGVLAACQADWEQTKGRNPSDLDKTHFLGPDEQTAVLHQTRLHSTPWWVLYERPGVMGSGTHYRTLDAAFAELAERGFVPQHPPLHWKMRSYWLMLEGRIQARMRFSVRS